MVEVNIVSQMLTIFLSYATNCLHVFSPDWVITKVEATNLYNQESKDHAECQPVEIKEIAKGYVYRTALKEIQSIIWENGVHVHQGKYWFIAHDKLVVVAG